MSSSVTILVDIRRVWIRWLVDDLNLVSLGKTKISCFLFELLDKVEFAGEVSLFIKRDYDWSS